AVQRGIDGSNGAGEAHRRVGGSVAGDKRQACDAAESQRAVGDAQRNADWIAVGVDVSDRDGVAVAGGEDKVVVLVDRLRSGDIVDRRVVYRIDGDVRGCCRGAERGG